MRCDFAYFVGKILGVERRGTPTSLFWCACGSWARSVPLLLLVVMIVLPEFEGYGVKVDKSVCEKSSKEIKKTPGALIIEDWVSDDEEQDESKPKKKSVIPTAAKIDMLGLDAKEQSDRSYDLEDPSKQGRNNAQIDEDHFGSDGCTESGEAGVQQRQKIMMKGRGFPEQK
ncbi:hypothetical protein Tco_1455458, partial [Tanacetum coccineum]